MGLAVQRELLAALLELQILAAAAVELVVVLLELVGLAAQGS